MATGHTVCIRKCLDKRAFVCQCLSVCVCVGICCADSLGVVMCVRLSMPLGIGVRVSVCIIRLNDLCAIDLANNFIILVVFVVE